MGSEAESAMLSRAGLPELLDHVAVLSWPFMVPWTLDSDPPVFLNYLLSSLTSPLSWPTWVLAQGDNEGQGAGLPAAEWGCSLSLSPAAVWGGGPGLSCASPEISQ